MSRSSFHGIISTASYSLSTCPVQQVQQHQFLQSGGWVFSWRVSLPVLSSAVLWPGPSCPLVPHQCLGKAAKDQEGPRGLQREQHPTHTWMPQSTCGCLPGLLCVTGHGCLLPQNLNKGMHSSIAQCQREEAALALLPVVQTLSVMTSRETSGGDGLNVKVGGVCLWNVKSKYVQQTASSPVAPEGE